MKYTKEIKIIQEIIKTLETTENKTFTDHITTYGTINYTRTQYLPQLSKKITEENNKNIFYNYTSTESMILDLLEVIESNTIKTIEQQPQNTKEMITFTTKLLKILEQILKEKEVTQQINETQNDYYKLIYDEKSDIRVK